MARTAVSFGRAGTGLNNRGPRPSPAKRAQMLRHLFGDLTDDRNDPLAEVMRPLSDMILLPAKELESWMLKGCVSGERDFRWTRRSRNAGRKRTKDWAGFNRQSKM